MKRIKVAVGALNQTPLDWDGNLERLAGILREAAAQQVSFLCLPELCITGYGCEDAFYSPAVQAEAWEVLAELLPLTRGMAVALGLPVLVRGGLYNVAAVSVDGELVGMVPKQHLAADGLHYEPRWFKAWPSGVQVRETIGGRLVPLGDLVFEAHGIRWGFEICEDAWVGSRPGSRLMKRGVDLIFNPSASHFAFGKHDVRQRFVLDGSRAFAVAYLYANLLGNEAGRSIYDGDTMIASCGQMLAVGERFSLRDYELTTTQIDLDEIRVRRTMIGSFEPDVAAAAQGAVTCPFVPPVASPELSSNALPAWETGPFRKEEEFARAMTLGLCDYLRKTRSQGFVVSLSGGADSSAVATLCALMVQRLWQELGSEAAQQRLGVTGLADPRRATTSTVTTSTATTSTATTASKTSTKSTKSTKSTATAGTQPHGAAQHAAAPADCDRQGVRELVQRLLTCAYQATRQSGEVTRHAAQQLAEALGARYCEWNVDGLVDEYVRLAEEAEGRSLSWSHDDVTLQNIQARARGPSVWMLANLHNALLLATSNRSEAAVGYATMDGDTCGGLSPIAGIDKAFLRHWLRWMETHGPAGYGPVPELQAVNEQAPTAELRPREQHQTDEADLMPYDLLDAVERAAIRDKHAPLDCWLRMVTLFPQYEPEQLRTWVDRFFRLWARNQWKRERYAPSFHVDDENLDPKTWCRFPILSGGYRRELRRLAEFKLSELPRGGN